MNIIVDNFTKITYISEVIGDSECKEICCRTIPPTCAGIITLKGSCFHFECGESGCSYRPAFKDLDGLNMYIKSSMIQAVQGKIENFYEIIINLPKRKKNGNRLNK